MNGPHLYRAPLGTSVPVRQSLHVDGAVLMADAPPVIVHPVTLLRCHQVTAHAQNVAMLEQVAPWVIAGPVTP